ncbi:cupin domain-containing protein [Mesorhizobium sp. LMG 17147]|uniref:cupin domain-containing protein n=1 Tax=Mesorhizobium sp. LMG 17147 TaxID=2963091 RepID=UPI0020CA0994|nr:cupin domain-containing protein [Mesorhizobium sp. LMG 17147]MCP9233284.1 cupin domain-containing protein [Mesorhizobium sp. LMG 17147]
MPNSFDWILWPIEATDFIETYWEKQFVHIRRNEPDYYRDVFSIAMFEEALVRNPPSLSWVSADQSSRTQLTPNRGYNSSDVNRAIEAFSTGSTIILDALHKHFPPLRRLCVELEGLLGIRFQANAYLTPPGRQGFRPHYDTHDVLVIQIHGSKKWRVGEEAFKYPLLAHNDIPGSRTIGSNYEEFSLEAGDALYIPRGVVHEAISESGTSLHITLGILGYTWADVVASCVARAIDGNPALRESLPLRYDRDQLDPALSERIVELIQKIAEPDNVTKSLECFMDECLKAYEGGLEGKLSTLILLESDSKLQEYRLSGANSFGEVLRDKDQVIVRCTDKEVIFPAQAEVAVRSCLEAQMAKPAELDRGNLEWSEFAVVVKRLAREGLLTAKD